MQVSTGKIARPRRIVLYGVGGIGKTTFAAKAPGAVFIPTEEGCNDLEVARFPIPSSFDDVLRYVSELYTEPHEFKTVVVDSLDWLESLIFARVCADNRVKTIADIDWGRGYLQALSYWKTLTEGLDAVRSARGMTTILVAHETSERYEDPETSGYDRHTLNLDKRARAHLIEWADEVLFAAYDIQVREAEGRGKRKVAKAIGGDRVLRCTQRPAAIAKNRLGLPDVIAFDWDVFSKYLQ